jgi:Ca2+-binding RTX toxin-like protein
MVDHVGDLARELAGEGHDLVKAALAADVTYALGDHVEDGVLTGSTASNLSGNALDNLLTGNAAANVLSGGDGNDTLQGGAGNDTLDGGLGDDTYVVDAVGDVIKELAGGGTDLVKVALATAGATYQLGSEVENAIITSTAAVHVTGNALDNELTGNAAANTLTGGIGNDTLDGGAGADKLIGGAGDDVYFVSESGDSITELAGEGDDMVYTSLSTYALPANLESLFYTGSGKFTGTGNAGDNLLAAGDGGSRLDGAGGNDLLIDGIGNDSLLGGAGDDLFYVLQGQDTVDGGAGNDLLDKLDFYENYTVAHVNATDILLTHYSGDTILVRNVELFNFAGTEMAVTQL